MKILVTGGAGYIGSHVCKALAARGIQPVVYDNLSRGHRWAVQWGPLEEGDIADGARVEAALARHQPAAVMHFAALAYIGESIENPSLYFRNNTVGSAALFRAMVSWRTVPIVFSSTCAVYGVPQTVPVTEDSPPQPINPYGASKLATEQMLMDLGRARDLPHVILRYFNAAGADPGGEIGEAHDPEPHLIPRVLASASDGNAVPIYGDDYDTADGTCVRDFVHVTDIAEAHVRALDYLLAGGGSCVLNLANARGYSVKEVVATAGRVCGKSIRTETVGRRPGDPPVLVGSADRANAVLGWIPQRSALETQIADAWKWMEGRRAPKPHLV